MNNANSPQIQYLKIHKKWILTIIKKCQQGHSRGLSTAPEFYVLNKKMKKYGNKIAILIVIIIFGYVGWTFLTAEEHAKKQDAEKVADHLQYFLNQEPTFTGIKAYPNKPEIGSVLIKGIVKDKKTMNVLRALINAKKDIEPIKYEITINSEQLRIDPIP